MITKCKETGADTHKIDCFHVKAKRLFITEVMLKTREANQKKFTTSKTCDFCCTEMAKVDPVMELKNVATPSKLRDSARVLFSLSLTSSSNSGRAIITSSIASND